MVCPISTNFFVHISLWINFYYPPQYYAFKMLQTKLANVQFKDIKLFSVFCYLCQSFYRKIIKSTQTSWSSLRELPILFRLNFNYRFCFVLMWFTEFISSLRELPSLFCLYVNYRVCFFLMWITEWLFKLSTGKKKLLCKFKLPLFRKTNFSATLVADCKTWKLLKFWRLKLFYCPFNVFTICFLFI